MYASKYKTTVATFDTCIYQLHSMPRMNAAANVSFVLYTAMPTAAAGLKTTPEWNTSHAIASEAARLAEKLTTQLCSSCA